MRLRYAMIVSLLIVAISGISIQNAVGQTRLGLHVTQEELNIWRQRASSGPYQNQWATIQSRADAFVANPDPRWTARTTGGCWVSGGTDTTPGRILDRGMRDAGLMYLLTGNAAYRNAVRTALLAQIAIPGTSFTANTNVWCSSNNFEQRYFEIANWVRRLVYAYDYIRPSLSASDITAIDDWLVGAANHFDVTMNVTLGWRFAGRLSDNYTCTGGSTFCPGYQKGLTHFGGKAVLVVHDGWNNILATGAAVVGVIGIQQNNETLKRSAKRFFTEWLEYGVMPGGIPIEQYRWSGNVPQTGYMYAGTTLGTMVTLADHFARAGDTSLYDLTTTEGIYGSESPGNPKSLHQVMQHFAGQTNGTILEYASTTSTSNSALIIDPVGAETHIEYIYMAPGNVYYNDAAIKTAYMTPILGSYTSGGYDPLGSEWGTYPMVLAMFGQMEGLVNPYGGTVTPPPPSPIIIDSAYPGYSPTVIDDGLIDATGGTATTWASAESSIEPHWITITLPSPKQLNTATIYWAFNNFRQTYMTSQQVDFQYWNGSSFQNVGSFIYTADMPSSTIYFPTITASQIRLYQPTNKGNPQYPTVLWITEVDYGTDATVRPPVAPSGLVTVSQ